MNTIANAIAPSVIPSARRPLSDYGKATLNFADATTAANYTLLKEPIFDADGMEYPPQFRGMVNSNTRKKLGIVGDDFTFYQPKESLEIMRAAIETVPGAKWRSVIVTHGGARISCFAELRTEIKAPKRGDKVGLSFFHNDCFNGKAKDTWGINATVLACTNGMTRSEQIFSLSGKHTPNLLDRVQSIRLELAMRIQDEVEKLQGFIYKLDTTPMSQSEMNNFSLRLFDIPDETSFNDVSTRHHEGKVSKQLHNKVSEIRTLFHRGTGNVGKTAWDAYNAVTEFADWHSTFKTTDNASEDENRFLSLMGGPVLALKDRAAELLLN